MYDRPETAGANDRLWQAIRQFLSEQGIKAPKSLNRDGDVWAHWQNPELIFSQTCSLPFRKRLSDHVHIIGAGDHHLEGCPAGTYRSVIIANVQNPISEIGKGDEVLLA